MARQSNSDNSPGQDDDVVTIRDIYSLVSQLNERTIELMSKVNTVTERAQEDRLRTDALASDIQTLKIKVYSAGAAIVLLGTIMVIFERLSMVSGK